MMWPIAGKIAQPQSILFIPRVVVFLIAATLPSRLPGPLPLWFVGLIFGIVIVVWNERSAKTAFTLTNAAFLGASTLIWILVLWILFRAANVSRPLMFGAVALGTVLLPVAHVALLGAPVRRLWVAIPGVFVVWYVFLSYLIPSVSALEFLDGGVLVWQAAYLVVMFGPDLLSGRQHMRQT